MKNEIQAAIQNLENDRPNDLNPKQNKSVQTNSSDKIPWKIIIPTSLFVLFLLIAGAVIFRKRKKR